MLINFCSLSRNYPTEIVVTREGRLEGLSTFFLHKNDSDQSTDELAYLSEERITATLSLNLDKARQYTMASELKILQKDLLILKILTIKIGTLSSDCQIHLALAAHNLSEPEHPHPSQSGSFSAAKETQTSASYLPNTTQQTPE